MTSLWLKETGLWRWADHTDLINAAFFVILLLHTDEPSTNNNTYDVCLQVSWFTSQQVPSSLRQISDQYLKLGHDHFLPCILKFVIRYNESFIYIYMYISRSTTAPSGPWPPHYRSFTITLRHTTIDRTPLDEWSARRRDFYLTTHNTHWRRSCPRLDLNPKSQEASGLRLTPRPRGHCDRHTYESQGLKPLWLPFDS